MNPLTLLLSAILAGGTVALTYEGVVSLYKAAHTQALFIEQQRDAMTLQHAKLQFQVDNQPGEPTVERLVELGYIDKSFLDRPRVGPPVELPESTDLTSTP